MPRLISCLLSAFVAAPALAHPGHGDTSDPVLHVISSPVHAWPLIAVVALLIGGLWATRRGTRSTKTSAR